MWQEITKIIFSTGFIVAGIVYLGKILINQFFSKDLEKFKANIEKEEFSYRIKYEKLHVERAEVIKQIYKKMTKTYRSFHSFMAPFQMSDDLPEKEKGEIAAKNANEFTDYFEENKIFLEKELADKVDKLSITFRSAWHKFQT